MYSIEPSTAGTSANPHFAQEAAELELRVRAGLETTIHLQDDARPNTIDELLCSALLRRTGMSVRWLDMTEGTSRTLTTLPSMNPNCAARVDGLEQTAAGVVVRQRVDQQASAFGIDPRNRGGRAVRQQGRCLRGRQHRQRQRVSVGAAVRELHVCHREKGRERRLQRTAVEHADALNRSRPCCRTSAGA